MHEHESVLLPKPTPWPLVTAFGITLLLSGLVTHLAVSIVGLILVVRAAAGWWCEVLPVEQHIAVNVIAASSEVTTSSRLVDHLAPGRQGHRVRVPAEIHPYSAGVLAGAIGAVAMALVALTFGLLSYGSIWYPINLLAAGLIESLASADAEHLKQFSAIGLMIAAIIHALASILVGVLYAVLLPMFPRRAGLWCGLIAPLVWSTLLASSINLINPTLNARIDWSWFVVSQIAYGLTAGYVVARSTPVETMQTWPLADRAGLEAPRTYEETR